MAIQLQTGLGPLVSRLAEIFRTRDSTTTPLSPFIRTCFPGSMGFDCKEGSPHLVDWETAQGWGDLGREALEGASELLVSRLHCLCQF